jgi:hypothetical protein
VFSRILWIVGSFFVCLPTQSDAQGVSTIEYQKTQVVMSLAGVVRDTAQSPLAGVWVEEFSSNWRIALRSTRSDQQGHFVMTPVKGRKTYFLQFSFRNCNPIRLRVEVDSKRGKELKVEMVNSA